MERPLQKSPVTTRVPTSVLKSVLEIGKETNLSQFQQQNQNVVEEAFLVIAIAI
jgi:hypothetical protein